MKKISDLTKKQLLIGSLIIGFLPIIALIIFFVFFLDTEAALNDQQIFRKINNNIVIKKEIGSISRISDAIEILVSEKKGNIEYVKMIARGGKGKYAVIEYWVNKNDSIWNLDSLHVLKISDKPIKYKK